MTKELFSIFRLKPTIFCDMCPFALQYMSEYEGREHVVVHPKNECARSGQIFKAPEVVLERV